MKKRKVVIIGGGVGGLSAAHELSERNFDVTVYERNRIVGGKARSISVEESATPGRKPLPGEHGFRFFPRWYRNLTDTLERIPYPKTGGTVAGNLVVADINLLASYTAPPVKALVRFPRSWANIKLVFKLPQEIVELVPRDDLEFFMTKMSQFVVSCEERRLQEIEPQSWWEFMEADRRSKPFQDYLVRGTTQSSVAANPRTASAYTIAKMAVQTFVDLVVPGAGADRVLNGPSQEVWLDPWRIYLEQQGVNFKLGWELQELEWGTRDELAAVRLSRTRAELKEVEAKYGTLQFLRDVIQWKDDATKLDWERIMGLAAYVDDLQLSAKDREISCELGHTLRQLGQSALPPSKDQLTELRKRARKVRESILERYRSSEAIPPHDELCRDCLRAEKGQPPSLDLILERATRAARDTSFAAPLWLLTALEQKFPDPQLDAERVVYAVLTGLRQQALDIERAEADYFIFALPVEQMAYYVNRCPTLTKIDAKLLDLVRLSEHVEWMAGIQFFLRERVDLTRGHVDLLDSEWALTAISQVQFWDDIDMKERGDGTCKSILSVDISAWTELGGLHKKPAWDCSIEEIAEEVWDQLKRSLNRAGQPPLLSTAQLVGGRLQRNQSFFLDESIIDRYDRKKQGLFEKFRRVAFDGGALVERQFETLKAADAPESFGPRVQINAEPLLVNRAGALALRPEAKTAVRNLFLAADYVKTSTNLACMEGANEAARHAVNGVVSASGMTQEPCDVWPLDEPLAALRALDRELLQYGQRLDVFTGAPIRMLSATSKVATGLASKALSFLKNKI